MRPTIQRTPWLEMPLRATVSGTATLERCAIWVPGYDCRQECEHVPPQRGNHGQHGDEIHAVIRSRILQDGLCAPLEFAASLSVFTHVRRGEAEIGFEGLTEPASISLHTSHVPLNKECGPGPCEYLWSGSCYNAEYSSFQSKEIWDKYVEIDFNQEILLAGSCAPRLLEVERVWTRLLKWHHDAVTYFIARRADDART